MKKRNAAESRERILKTAESLFSMNGYDATRVEDIASEASVNKALIYYYFTSKEDIRETLFSTLVEDVQRIISDCLSESMDIRNEDDFRQIFDVILAFLTKKSNVLRIAMMESLKRGGMDSILAHVLGLITRMNQIYLPVQVEQKAPGHSKNYDETNVFEFFTGIMPMVYYVLYKDNWMIQCGLDEKQLDRMFFNSFWRTHIMAYMPAPEPGDGCNDR